MNITKKVEKILIDFDDWGYKYRISDYCTSETEEAEEEKQGLKDIENLAKQIDLLYRKEIENKDFEDGRKDMLRAILFLGHYDEGLFLIKSKAMKALQKTLFQSNKEEKK